jgi:hypothetical protein
MSHAPAAAPTVATPHKREITVISHCTLFYWWPVWAVGFLMAAITLFDHHLMTTVPKGTKLEVAATGTLMVVKDPHAANPAEVPLNKQDVLIAPVNTTLSEPKLEMTQNKSLGVVFAITLLLVIVITNVPLRGLWSVIVIVVIVLMSIIFALAGIWEKILAVVSPLDIRINLAGYLFISTILLAGWLVVFFFFDRQVYMVFTPGSLRVQLEIGDGETAYDTQGMTVQKQRSDLFRHWILGLGSGDLIVTTAGAQVHHFDLPNVLSLGRRVREIEELLRMKEVVASSPRPKG